MRTPQTYWWFLWMMGILGSFYYFGPSLGLPMIIGAVVGAAVVWSRRTRA